MPCVVTGTIYSEAPPGTIVQADEQDLSKLPGHVVRCKTTTGREIYIVNLHLERA